ncbi:MAG: BamA/TamA family outer membrane protein [Arachidicoccus sp.]|nr:BamA/TamA family outer membrane protein [Arachidicoccus sp.]
MIFIGDAGEISDVQRKIMHAVSEKILHGKTTVMFLGDNIYPNGMALPDTKDVQKTRAILLSQYAPMRAKGAAVYFIPGNHDWDNSGPHGLDKIKQQWQFVEEQEDSLLKFVPENGCPDPYLINVSDSVVIIAMDSEWWLYPYNKKNEDGDCNCNSARDVLTTLREMLYQNRYKTILFATHHPFESYGTHGGYFTWKDHLFPLTHIAPFLYIPLPIVGSLYPLSRKAFPNAEDIRHPLYKQMTSSIDDVFKGFLNVIHVSGHEHGLQLIEDSSKKITQVVSGGGAKENYTFKGKNSLFAKEDEGFVIADVMQNNQLKFTYYSYVNDTFNPSYVYYWDPQPYKYVEDSSYQSINGDSITAVAHGAYKNVSGIHKFLFGKNYREEWSMPAKLPVIRVSAINGGLKPEQLGGGYQSTSLRMIDANGNEYALRSVEKSPDLIVPVAFQGTFVKEWLEDATSSQHPYSSLVVPILADAIGVPHSHPVIGVAAPDKNLGQYNKLFEGKTVLLEERNPLGKSDNFEKLEKNLHKDNDNSYDAINFLKARTMDLMLADWDRHGDQWRFYNKNKKNDDEKYYIGIPRDRDMVFNVTEGLIPTLLKRLLLMPRIYGFNNSNVLDGAKYYEFKSSFLNQYPSSQIPHDVWTKTVAGVQSKFTNDLLQKSLQSMPKEVYDYRGKALLKTLEIRRDKLSGAMERYYRFSNRIVDIQLSDKNEYVQINNTRDSNALQITVLKINKKGNLKDTLMNKLYPHSITKEIRLYLSKGDDSIAIDNKSSSVKLRIIGDKGSKVYNIINSKQNIKVYDHKEETYLGDVNKLSKTISRDTMNTRFVPTNLYNTSLPLITGSYNVDDGVFLGLGVRLTQQRGFRKSPYTSLQQIMVSHSFATSAYNIKYNGEWIDVLGNADFTLSADVRAPDNTQNFFGFGNETPFDKTGDYKRYYRTRFNVVNVLPALRWRFDDNKSSLSVGPAYQHYHFNIDYNTGRFINNVSSIHNYDSSLIEKDKNHLGINASYVYDHRNNPILPKWGTYAGINFETMFGMNDYSKTFTQLLPQFAIYKTLNNAQTIIFADRVGGGVTFGKPAFYQAIYLGGQNNLLGFKQYRFAGDQAFYNNMELRIALSDFGNYILKGEFGLSGFYDIGRVWAKNESSDKWHSGIGGGIYLAPASMFVIRFNMGYSTEGWYPYFSMGMRF